MFDDLTAATSSLPAERGVWYDAGDSIPYLDFRASRCRRTLSPADIARWMKAPVVRP